LANSIVYQKGDRNIRSAKEFLADQIKFETMKYDKLRHLIEEEDE